MLMQFSLVQHLEMHKADLVPTNHVVYRRLIKIIDQVVTSNKDIPSIQETPWSLAVITTPLVNSYVLPVCVYILY